MTDLQHYAAFACFALAAAVSCFIPVPTDLTQVLTDVVKAGLTVGGLCLRPPWTTPPQEPRL